MAVVRHLSLFPHFPVSIRLQKYHFDCFSSPNSRTLDLLPNEYFTGNFSVNRVIVVVGATLSVCLCFTYTSRSNYITRLHTNSRWRVSRTPGLSASGNIHVLPVAWISLSLFRSIRFDGKVCIFILSVFPPNSGMAHIVLFTLCFLDNIHAV